MESIFYNNWQSLVRILIIGVLAYASLIILLRVSGKRTLTKMNAFDFVVTVALGSTLASVLLSKDVTLSDGILAFSVLIFLQYVVTWLSVRSKSFSNFIKSEPRLLFFQGEFLQKAMRSERITENELIAVARKNGISSLEEVDAMILETNGKVNVIEKLKPSTPSLLSNVNSDGKL